MIQDEILQDCHVDVSKVSFIPFHDSFIIYVHKFKNMYTFADLKKNSF